VPIRVAKFCLDGICVESLHVPYSNAMGYEIGSTLLKFAWAAAWKSSGISCECVCNQYAFRLHCRHLCFTARHVPMVLRCETVAGHSNAIALARTRTDRRRAVFGISRVQKFGPNRRPVRHQRRITRQGYPRIESTSSNGADIDLLAFPQWRFFACVRVASGSSLAFTPVRDG